MARGAVPTTRTRDMAIERLSTLRTPGMAAQPATEEGSRAWKPGCPSMPRRSSSSTCSRPPGSFRPTSWRSCAAAPQRHDRAGDGRGGCRVRRRHRAGGAPSGAAGRPPLAGRQGGGADGAAARARAGGCRPYALDNGTLRAIADPGNIHGIDELRLATPSDRCRRGVPRRRSRRDQAHGARCRGVRRPRGPRGGAVRSRRRARGGGRRPRAEDGISDAPLVRLVNSVIFQAAEDGASDVHFEPQEDALVVRFRVDGVLQEVAASRGG